MKAETNALRITAKGKSTESWLLQSGWIRFAARLTNQRYRLLQVWHIEENVNLRRFLGVTADSH